MSMSKKEVKAAIQQVRKERTKRFGPEAKSEERLAKLGWRIRQRQIKSNMALIKEIARKLDIDLAALEVEHKKSGELLRRAAAKEKKELGRTIRSSIGYRRRIKASISKLRDSHYNVVRSNPGVSVCDWNAEADGGDTLSISNANSVDHAVERIRGPELGENHIRTRIEAENDSSIHRIDWFEFIWEPTQNGVANISAVFQPTGTISCIATEEEKWGRLSATAHAWVFAWMDVAQVTNSGLNFFPEVGLNLYAEVAQGEEVVVRRMYRESTIDFHQNIPILASYPLVITAGYDFFANSMWGPCSAEIDMNSMTGFAASVPMVLINLKS
jgi:hypothetical protein